MEDFSRGLERIDWDPRLRIGFPMIDAQHEELFRRAGALVVAMQGQGGREEAARLFPYLESYIVEHFSAEEGLMAARGYPGTADHVAEHRWFVRAFAVLMAEVEKTGPAAAAIGKTAALIEGWLKAHIAKTDLALGIFLTCDVPPRGVPRLI